MRNEIEDLSERVDALESSTEESRFAREDGIGLFYALGMAIAVTLSWARNAVSVVHPSRYLQLGIRHLLRCDTLILEAISRRT